MRVLLDTNVLLDIVEKREPAFGASYEVFIKSAAKEIDADFEDAVITATASREQADYIITGNTKDFSKSSVPAISPSEFLKQAKAP
jgi:predicted nucleic acid-binding protein